MAPPKFPKLRVVGADPSEMDRFLVRSSSHSEGAFDHADSGWELQTEAQAIEAWYGINAYSEFLKKHRRRPDRNQAAAIGRILGARVKADDGSMQPTLTKHERSALRQIAQRRATITARYANARRLRQALEDLSANELEPTEVAEHLSTRVDVKVLLAKLESARAWLNRFAQEWESREQKACTEGKKSAGGNSR